MSLNEEQKINTMIYTEATIKENKETSKWFKSKEKKPLKRANCIKRNLMGRKNSRIISDEEHFELRNLKLLNERQEEPPKNGKGPNLYFIRIFYAIFNLLTYPQYVKAKVCQ